MTDCGALLGPLPLLDPTLTLRPRTHASLEDWLRYKDRITQLYITKNKTLKDVRRTMEHEHAFFATPKMYKSKFTAWKLDRKHVKRKDVQDVLRQVARLAEFRQPLPRTFIGGDCEVGLEQIRQYFRRSMGIDIVTFHQSQYTCATPRYTPSTTPRGGTHDAVESFFYFLSQWARLCLQQRLCAVQETMLVFPDRNNLETAVQLLGYVKAAGKTRQPLEVALKIVWPRMEILLDCQTRISADDVRFATFEMLMKVNSSGSLGADFEEHTNVCILHTLEAYLGDQHLALFDLAIEWGRETYVKVPVATFEVKVVDIMATHEDSPLDYESVRYLWNIASYFALVPKNLIQVSQIADWLVHLITSGQHTLDDWQKQQVISGFWILQRDIAYSGGDPEACATADLKLLQFRVDCSKTIVEKVTWLSHGAQKLQDLGHVYSEIAEAIRTSIDAEVYQDMLMADSEDTGCEPPGMTLESPPQFPRTEDCVELHSKEHDQGLLWEPPHTTSEDEDEISSDWPSTICDTTMLRSCAQESNIFLEPNIYSGYQI